jgi:hypothetical protein
MPTPPIQFCGGLPMMGIAHQVRLQNVIFGASSLLYAILYLEFMGVAKMQALFFVGHLN